MSDFWNPAGPSLRSGHYRAWTTMQSIQTLHAEATWKNCLRDDYEFL